jgi:hypothetical protein
MRVEPDLISILDDEELISWKVSSNKNNIWTLLRRLESYHTRVVDCVDHHGLDPTK